MQQANQEDFSRFVTWLLVKGWEME